MNWLPSVPEVPELRTCLREPTPGIILLRFRSGLALRFLLDQLRKDLHEREVYEVPYSANTPETAEGSPRTIVQACEAHSNNSCPIVVLLPNPNELRELDPLATARFWKQLNAHREPLGGLKAQVLLCVSEGQVPYAFSHARDLISWCSPKFELPQIPQGSLVIVPQGSPGAIARTSEEAMRTLVATHGPLWEDILKSGRKPSDGDLRQIYFPLALAWVELRALAEASRILEQAPPWEELSPRARANLLQLQGELSLLKGEIKEGVQQLYRALQWWQTEARSQASDAVIQGFVERITDRLTVALAELGHLDDAISMARASLQRSEQSLTPASETAEHLRRLSVDHSRLGELLIARGELDEAGRHVAEDLRISEQFLAQDPANPQSIADLGVAHLKSAELLVAQGRIHQAQGSLRLALESARMALSKAPESAQVQRLATAILTNRGYVEMMLGNLALAIRNLLEAEALAERAALSSPMHFESQRNLVTIRALIAQLFDQSGAPAAKAAWERLVHQIEAMESRGTLASRELQLLHLARAKVTA